MIENNQGDVAGRVAVKIGGLQFREQIRVPGARPLFTLLSWFVGS
jgi:hypothetical protein